MPAGKIRVGFSPLRVWALRKVRLGNQIAPIAEQLCAFGETTTVGQQQHQMVKVLQRGLGIQNGARNEFKCAVSSHSH